MLCFGTPRLDGFPFRRRVRSSPCTFDCSWILPTEQVLNMKTEKIDATLIHSYPFTIRPLDEADGGGFLIEYPDLPGCLSDGETPEQAMKQGRDAVKAYLLDCAKHGDPIPKPSEASGQWRQRVPKSLHARLAAKARQEGVSLNTLVTAMIAEGLGKRAS
jgi:antitoxin HicB